MAVLAAFLFYKSEGLDSFLKTKVFKDAKKITICPESDIIDGFNQYITDYKKMILVEQTAVTVF